MVLINQFSYATVADSHRQDFVIANDALVDRLLKRQLKKSCSVILFAVVHRENIITCATMHPFSRSHEKATPDFDLFIIKQSSERFGRYAYSLVRFIKNSEIKLYSSLSCRRSKLVTALVRCEYDLRSMRPCAKQYSNILRIGVRRQPEFIDFSNKVIAFKIRD